MPSSGSSPPLPESPSAEPLGFKHPLLPIRTLGQNWLSPKFLTPLGAHSLTVLDPTLFSPQAASGAGSLSPEFADSPFFTNVRSNRFESQVTSVAPQRRDSVGRSSRPLPAVQPRLEPFPVQAAADDLDDAPSVESHSAAGSQPSEGSDAAIAVESASIPSIARPETVQSAPSRLQPAPEAWGEPASQQQQPRPSPNPVPAESSRPIPEAASLIPPTIQTRHETGAASPAPAVTELVPDLQESISEFSDSVSPQSSAPPTLQTRSQPAINSAQQVLPKQNSSPAAPTPLSIADSTPATPSPDSVLFDRRDIGAAQTYYPAPTFPLAETLNPTSDRPDSLNRTVPTVQARLESSPTQNQEPVSPADASEPAEQPPSGQQVSASQPIFPLPASPTPETAQSAMQPEPGSATAADTPAASTPPPVIQTRLEPTLPERSDQGSGHGPAIAPPFASSMPEFASSPPVIQARSEPSVPESLEMESANQNLIVPSSQPDSQSSTPPSLPTVQPQLEPSTRSRVDATEREATTAQALNSAPSVTPQPLPAVPSIQRQQSPTEPSPTEPSLTEPSTVSIDHPLDTAAEPTIADSSKSTLQRFEQVDFTHLKHHTSEQSQPAEPESVDHQNQPPGSSPIAPDQLQSTAAPTVQARFHPQPELSVESNFIHQSEITSSASISASPTSTSPTPSIAQSPTTPHDSASVSQASEVASTIQSPTRPQISLRPAGHSPASAPQPATGNAAYAPSSLSTEFTTNADVTESEADSEPTIVPPLPTVLTNLSTLKPLGGVKPLARSTDFLTVPDAADQNSEAPATPSSTEADPVVQAKADAMPAASVNANDPGQTPTVDSVPPIDPRNYPASLISSSSSRNPSTSAERSSPSTVASENWVPDLWSSIDELLSQSAAPRSAPIVQRFVDDGSLDQLIHQPHPSDLARPLLNDVPATPLNAESPAAHTNASVGERQDSPGSDRASTPADQASADHAAADNDSDALESLAREIYGLLRQRLEIERERQGNDYSGRLPW